MSVEYAFSVALPINVYAYFILNVECNSCVPVLCIRDMLH